MHELSLFVATHPVAVFLGLAALMVLLSATLWWGVQRLRLPLYRLSARSAQWLGLQSHAQVLGQRYPLLQAIHARTFSGTYLFMDLLLGFALAASALTLFLVVADETGLDEDLGRFDLSLAAALSQTLSSGTLRAFSWITHLGDAATLTVLCIAVAGLLLWREQRLLAACWIAAVAGNGLLNRTLKAIFERTRPLHDHGWTQELGWSFPSGHSSGALTAYGMLAYLLIRRTSQVWHLPLTLLAITLILLVGYSRIVLQVHWFSDVVAGFASGTAWLLVCIAIAEIARAQNLNTAAATPAARR